ncbi:Zinc finger protein [Wickerhamomyces ciferrii]|uniref:Zinc finger protein n=1 Tax=Wickerhamomyces ciferrii (strain ATCC 14091 / BCRC 22168 / CBS 111 / JCM 3599 / NBRC 0793 / NRRL Y-1031 F-60-10) TaxID=1206466 RepID=K0KHT9_WICCF|nr:Zinc finger protein [Wickerhamomyces ciferrii]CCH42581.1 Zinc finger protein [Wickerhamomyces ciferrii]
MSTLHEFDYEPESIDSFNPLINQSNQSINQIDNMYELLLQNNNNNDQDDQSSINSMNFDNYKYSFPNSSVSSIIPNNNTTTTINPKKLNSRTNSIDINFNLNLNDEGPLDQNDNNKSNWLMNEEFKNAIATWINQNEKSNTTTTKKSKSNSISYPSLNYQKTSITKRRKSDSIIPQFPTTSSSSSSSTPSSSSSLIPETSSIISINQEFNELDEDAKPFKCEECPKAFRRSEHLKRHFRSVHSNIRPFPCKFCEKKFSRSDNLAQHLRTHKH